MRATWHTKSLQDAMPKRKPRVFYPKQWGLDLLENREKTLWGVRGRGHSHRRSSSTYPKGYASSATRSEAELEKIPAFWGQNPKTLPTQRHLDQRVAVDPLTPPFRLVAAGLRVTLLSLRALVSRSTRAAMRASSSAGNG